MGSPFRQRQGNIGVFHAAVVGALIVFGVSQERALAAAIVMHATSIGVMLVGGAVSCAWDRASARFRWAGIGEPLSTDA